MFFLLQHQPILSGTNQINGSVINQTRIKKRLFITASFVSGGSYIILICLYQFQHLPLNSLAYFDHIHASWHVPSHQVAIAGCTTLISTSLPCISYIRIISADPGEGDIIQKINRLSVFLKKEKNCDLVVCLSRLGFKNKNTPDDIFLATFYYNLKCECRRLC